MGVGGSKGRKVDPVGCEVHRGGGGLDPAACRDWGGRGGEGEGLWEEGRGQSGENNGVTKVALFRSCGRGKTGISQG